jgi:hypothetical protein
MLKKQDKFLKLNNQINRLIDSKKFDEAVKQYLNLSKVFKNQNQEEKSRNEELFNKTRIQLLTYQKINEISYALESNNLEMIKSHLNLLEEYLSVPTIKKIVKEHAEKKLKHFTKVYEYKIHKREIERLLKEVYHKIYEENYDGALGMFPKVFEQYNQLIKSFPNEELYKYLTELRDHLKISLLENRPRGKVAQHTKPKE